MLLFAVVFLFPAEKQARSVLCARRSALGMAGQARRKAEAVRGRQAGLECGGERVSCGVARWHVHAAPTGSGDRRQWTPPLAVEDLRRRALDPPAMPQAGGDRCRDGVAWAEFISLALLQPNENERVHHVQCLQNG